MEYPISYLRLWLTLKKPLLRYSGLLKRWKTGSAAERQQRSKPRTSLALLPGEGDRQVSAVLAHGDRVYRPRGRALDLSPLGSRGLPVRRDAVQRAALRTAPQLRLLSRSQAVRAERPGARFVERLVEPSDRRVAIVRPFALGIGVVDQKHESLAGSGGGPLEHLKVAVGVAERSDRPTADV